MGVEARISRRRLLRDAGAAAAAAGLYANPALARAVRRHHPGRRVAVLGGGMAGLAAAHELVIRGFEVDVYEPTAYGGKARGIPGPHQAPRGPPAPPPAPTVRLFPA